MREKDFQERVEELLKEYYDRYEIDFKQEFYVKELVKLKVQYEDTPNEHIRTKSDLMKLILDLEKRLVLNDKIPTINLINELEDYSLGLIKTTVENNNLLFKANMSDVLNNRLNQGRKVNKLINVSGFRDIGKTHQLINFAKQNDYIVIVRYGDFRDLRKEYNYGKIHNQYDRNLKGKYAIKNCVVDECVDINWVKNQLGLNIITGYMSK